MDSAFIIEKSVIIVVVFALTMLMAMYSTWAERKVAAFYKIVWDQTVQVGVDYYNRLPMEPNYLPKKNFFQTHQIDFYLF